MLEQPAGVDEAALQAAAAAVFQAAQEQPMIYTAGGDRRQAMLAVARSAALAITADWAQGPQPRAGAGGMAARVLDRMPGTAAAIYQMKTAVGLVQNPWTLRAQLTLMSSKEVALLSGIRWVCDLGQCISTSWRQQ